MKPTVFILLVMAIQSCRNQPDFEKEKSSLLALHKSQQQAHFGKNVALLIDRSSPDFIEVNGGAVDKPVREKSRKRFQSYFNEVDFIKWEDVSPPVFSFSDDASMATSVVEKLVVTKQKRDGGWLDTVHYAWLAVYKKINGQWQLERIASTNK